MPEGDTIFRTAASLRTWLIDREITAARALRPDLGISRLVGRTVTAVEANGKNLLMTFSAGSDAPSLVLHTHMRMTGSWHVYPVGAPWRKPERQARVVLTAGERVAVCFNAPIIELASAVATARRASIASLGPDVLVDPFDLDEVWERAVRQSADRALGEVLLDQRIVAGIGNIYRCESLFLRGLHPWTALGALDRAAFDALVMEAATLMRANLGPSTARSFGAGPSRPWVYRRAGLPCRRCGTTIRSRPQGPQARVAYWCSTCQPEPSAGPDTGLVGGG